MRNPISNRFIAFRKTLLKSLHVLLATLGIFALVGESRAATLYGSTSAGGPGELYVLNPATGGVIQDVGPLNDAFGANYPVTGLSFNPITGVLYGSTGNAIS